MVFPAPAITARQGGDLRTLKAAGELLDLSSCVNLYGPPPVTAEVLRAFDTATLRRHSYGLEDEFRSAYGLFLGGVDPQHLIPARGITEQIRILDRLLPRRDVAVLVPDYTDYVRIWPVHLGPAQGVVESADSRAQRLDEAMASYGNVVLSNPNNPLGIFVDTAVLTEIAAAHPDSRLIVDEAYLDFLPGFQELTMMHCGLPNVVVLRSPNKLFGLASARTGAMWTLDEDLRAAAQSEVMNWPLSLIDVEITRACLRDGDWAAKSRASLADDARDLEQQLEQAFPGAVIAGVPVHFRFVSVPDPVAQYSRLLSAGVVVRPFDGAEPGRMDGFRVTAGPGLARLRAALAGN